MRTYQLFEASSLIKRAPKKQEIEDSPEIIAVKELLSENF